MHFICFGLSIQAQDKDREIKSPMCSLSLSLSLSLSALAWNRRAAVPDRGLERNVEFADGAVDPWGNQEGEVIHPPLPYLLKYSNSWDLF